MSARNPDEQRVALECLDRALGFYKGQMMNPRDVIATAGAFVEFVTGSPSELSDANRKAIVDAILDLYDRATDEDQVRRLIDQHVRAFAKKGLPA